MQPVKKILKFDFEVLLDGGGRCQGQSVGFPVLSLNVFGDGIDINDLVMVISWSRG